MLIDVLTLADLQTAYRLCENPRDRMLVLLAAATGFDPGRLAALRVGDAYAERRNPAERFLYKGRRCTSRTPYQRVWIGPELRRALAVYWYTLRNTAWDAALIPDLHGHGRSLHPRQCTRILTRLAALAVVARVPGDKPAPDETTISPRSYREYFRARMKLTLGDQPYVYRVACGVRLPRGDTWWLKPEGLRVRAAQEHVLDGLDLGETMTFLGSNAAEAALVAAQMEGEDHKEEMCNA